MTRSYKNFPKTRPRNPINIRDPEYRMRVEATKKQRLNRQLEREAIKQIKDYDGNEKD